MNQHLLVQINQYLQLRCSTFQIARLCLLPTSLYALPRSNWECNDRLFCSLLGSKKMPESALLRPAPPCALCIHQKLSKEPHDTAGTSDAFDQLVLANIISMHSFEKIMLCTNLFNSASGFDASADSVKYPAGIDRPNMGRLRDSADFFHKKVAWLLQYIFLSTDTSLLLILKAASMNIVRSPNSPLITDFYSQPLKRG